MKHILTPHLLDVLQCLQLTFSYSQENCLAVPSHAEPGGFLYCKPVSEILCNTNWDYDAGDILFVDDSPAKMSVNHPNQSICFYSWDVDMDMGRDQVLTQELLPFLKGWIGSSDTVYDYVERNQSTLQCARDTLDSLNSYWWGRNRVAPSTNPYLFQNCPSTDRAKFLARLNELMSSGRGKQM